jgi:GNAT superfamily N-acetyltransferase
MPVANSGVDGRSAPVTSGLKEASYIHMETIEQLTVDRVDWLETEFTRLAWAKSSGYFQRCYDAQEQGEVIVLVARSGEQLHGYVKLVWHPDYLPFRERGIPEIQDLNVVPASRRKGVATRLLDKAEEIIATRSAIAGIGVGLHPGYAAAQKMYILRGYVPDAMPVTYRNEFVTEGQEVVLDDELVLHLTKQLGSQERRIRRRDQSSVID